MTTTQEAPEGERLARLEATTEAVVREVGLIRQDIRDLDNKVRTYFLWTLGNLVGILAPSIIGLIVTLILKA